MYVYSIVVMAPWLVLGTNICILDENGSVLSTRHCIRFVAFRQHCINY